MSGGQTRINMRLLTSVPILLSDRVKGTDAGGAILPPWITSGFTKCSHPLEEKSRCAVPTILWLLKRWHCLRRSGMETLSHRKCWGKIQLLVQWTELFFQASTITCEGSFLIPSPSSDVASGALQAVVEEPKERTLLHPAVALAFYPKTNVNTNLHFWAQARCLMNSEKAKTTSLSIGKSLGKCEV